MNRPLTSTVGGSRTLGIAALVAFALAGLVPLVAMVPLVSWQDITGLFDERAQSLLVRTLRLGGSVAAIAFLLGTPFGFLVSRTDLPGAGVFRTLGIAPLLAPTLLAAMVWVVLVDQPGEIAAILVLGLSTFPLVSLFTARAFERIDARREEAALLAGGLRAVLRMELPLVLPAAFAGTCLAFAFAINDFGVPDYVSFAGRKFNVYADEIFATWKIPEDRGRAVALSIPLVALTLGALLPALALRRRGSLATLGADFVRPRPLRLGRLRWPAFVFALGVISLAVLIPFGQLLWEACGGPSALRDEDGPRGAALLTHLVEKGRESFAYALENRREDLRNSLLYSSIAATLCVPIGLVVGHWIERTRRRSTGKALETFSLLPLAVPSVLFGMGFVTAWNRPWPVTDAVYTSGVAVVLLYAGRFLPFAVLVLSGASASLDRRPEEAAASAGVGPIRRMVRIVAPMLRGPMLGAWVLVFVFSMRELDSAIMVQAANGTAVFRVFNSVHFGRDAFVAAMSLLLVFTIVLPGLLWTLFARRRLEVLP